MLNARNPDDTGGPPTVSMTKRPTFILLQILLTLFLSLGTGVEAGALPAGQMNPASEMSGCGSVDTGEDQSDAAGLSQDGCGTQHCTMEMADCLSTAPATVAVTSSSAGIQLLGCSAMQADHRILSPVAMQYGIDHPPKLVLV